MGLGICKACRRFARGETCPFCGAAVDAPLALPLGRRTRAGKLVGHAAAAVVALAGCSSADYGGPHPPSNYEGGVTTDAGSTNDAEGGTAKDAGDGG